MGGGQETRVVRETGTESEDLSRCLGEGDERTAQEPDTKTETAEV